MTIREEAEIRSLMAALRESEARARAVLETAADGIITVDESGIIDSFNPAAERLFGYAAEEVIGRDVAMLTSEALVDAHGNVVREVSGQRKDGTTVPLELTVSEHEINGRPMVTAFVRDISRRRRDEAQLRALQRNSAQRERLADVGAITAKILHDLANPIAGLSMQVQLILRRAARDPGQPLSSVLQPASHIFAEVQRLDTLLREFKDFARDQRLELRPLAVQPFLQECVGLWRPLARSHNIALGLEASPDLPIVQADRDKLRRVVDNLLKNAIEAIDRPPGRVTIRTSLPAPETVRISVEDNGQGVPDTLQLFKLFETTKPYGTGLGLAIAKQIVQAHGGSIEHIPGEPRGSIFHLDLMRSGPDPSACWIGS